VILVVDVEVEVKSKIWDKKNGSKNGTLAATE